MSTRFRGDIQGLRAIAVIAVLLYHAGVPWMGGGYVGVDVFFVVSGFLITGLLVRELDQTGTVDLGRFYARRARRLLPASAVALIAVGALTYVFLPASRWASIAGDMVASTFYVMNWRLAAGAVDYLGVDQAPSPLQHFWSLAVEEQFYLIWPIVLVGATLWHRRRGLKSARALGVALALVGVPSFAWSVVYTNWSGGQAYFVTTTRLWELALGGGLAMVVAVWQPRARQAEALAALGLLAVAWSAIAYTSDTMFPGWAAALPTFGTAMVIAAGTGEDLPVLSKVLAVRPLQMVGDLSYSLYLWHWPMVVVALSFVEPLPVSLGLLAVAASFVPAWLTTRYVEDPIRFADGLRSVRRSVVVGSACSIGALFAAGALALAPTPSAVAIEADDPGLIPTSVESTTSLPGSPPPTATVIIPNPLDASKDRPVGYYPDCQQTQDSAQLVRCDYGESGGDFLVALVGDSHAAQWVDALDLVSKSRSWQLVTFTKSSCPFADVTVAKSSGGSYESCDQWNQALIEELANELRPDLVITSNSREYSVMGADGPMGSAESRDSLAQGLYRTWRSLASDGIPVVPIRDTPRPGINVPECVLEASSYLDECSVPTAVAMAGNTAQMTAAELLGIGVVDMTDRICNGDSCRPVESAVLVWRDSNHLTNTYALRISTDLGIRIDEVLIKGS